jgi:hypothetical protein
MAITCAGYRIKYGNFCGALSFFPTFSIIISKQAELGTSRAKPKIE